MKISSKATATLEERSNRRYYVEKFAMHVLLHFLKKIRNLSFPRKHIILGKKEIKFTVTYNYIMRLNEYK